MRHHLCAYHGCFRKKRSCVKKKAAYLYHAYRNVKRNFSACLTSHTYEVKLNGSGSRKSRPTVGSGDLSEGVKPVRRLDMAVSRAELR